MIKLVRPVFLAAILILSIYLGIAAQSALVVAINELDYHGFLFMTPATDAYQSCAVYDLSGQLIYEIPTEARCSNFHQLAGGDWVYYDSAANMWIRRAAYSDTIKATYSISGSLNDGHDIIVTDDYVWLMGRADYVAITGTLAITLRGSTLQKQDLQGNVLFDWHSKDYIAPNEATLPIRSGSSFPHSNSFHEDTDGNLIVSFRNTNSVIKICVTDGGCQAGDIIWRLGGLKSDFVFANGDRGFAKQHHAQMIEDICHEGASRCLILFDNGNDFIPQYSRVVEYVLGQGIVTRTWEYTAGGQIYSFATGGVQRLPTGDTLISWGLAQITDPNDPSLTIVDWEGGIVCEATLPGARNYRTFICPEWRRYLPIIGK